MWDGQSCRILGNLFCTTPAHSSSKGSWEERVCGGRAVEDGDEHNRLSVYNHDDGYGKFQGYDVGWFAPCKDKSIDHEITADVAAIAPSLYKKSR